MRLLDRLRRSPVIVREVAGSPTPWQDAWLAVRMAGWATVLPVFKHVVPVRALARVMWKGGRAARRMSNVERGMSAGPLRTGMSNVECGVSAEKSARRNPVREQLVVRLAGLLSRGTNLTTRGACLQRSLLAYRYLSELGADPRLMLAFRKDGDRMAGHAWVMVDGRVVADTSDQAEDFIPIVAFGAGGRTVA